jgi:hypothetical protein
MKNWVSYRHSNIQPLFWTLRQAPSPKVCRRAGTDKWACQYWGSCGEHSHITYTAVSLNLSHCQAIDKFLKQYKHNKIWHFTSDTTQISLRVLANIRRFLYVPHVVQEIAPARPVGFGQATRTTNEWILQFALQQTRRGIQMQVQYLNTKSLSRKPKER